MAFQCAQRLTRFKIGDPETICSGLPTILDLAFPPCYEPKGWKLAASNAAEGRGEAFRDWRLAFRGVERNLLRNTKVSCAVPNELLN